MTPAEKQQTIFVYLTNKMLKKHGVDFLFISNSPIIEGKQWREYYTWTQDEKVKFYNEAVSYIKETMRIYSKRQCAQIAIRFISKFGLKTI